MADATQDSAAAQTKDVQEYVIFLIAVAVIVGILGGIFIFVIKARCRHRYGGAAGDKATAKLFGAGAVQSVLSLRN